MQLVKLFLYLSLALSPFSLAGEIDELFIKRSIVEKKLKESGYSRWFEIQREYIAQSARVETLHYKNEKHKNDYLKLVKSYQNLQELQKIKVKDLAKEDLEAAQALALKQATDNFEKEEKIIKLRDHQLALDDLLKKHRKLKDILEKEEKVTRQKMQANRRDVDNLVEEWKKLDKAVKEKEAVSKNEGKESR